ncbi:MAG: sigma-54 dependent transcriptional regulator [Peptococcaceae bacterium]|nr:sigma-54 dependent transcriptional regulator [Peptococcaceae bacterium]
MRKRILIVDDEPTLRLSLKEALTNWGYQADVAKSGLDAVKMLGENYHLIFLDLKLPDRDGLDVLADIRKGSPDTMVIIMTAYGTTSSTVTAIKMGAYDYLNKPFDLVEIKFLIERALSSLQIERESHLFRKQQQLLSNQEIVHCSPAMSEVLKKVEALAAADTTTVLITGETGTGKELVARTLHKKSIRAEKPFIAINCGAIPPSLLESELFGFERSAFTGATKPKKGLLELGDEGTIFLDEIGELPLEMQVKLLRFLEDRKVSRLGGLQEHSVNVRVIVATNRNLEQMVAKKTFRDDLYYRINVVPVRLPPLRERKEDIPLLAGFFLNLFNKQFNKRIARFSPEALCVLQEYGWPGNVRELKNVVEHLAILCDSEIIGLKHLPTHMFSMQNSECNAGTESLSALDGKKIPENFSLEATLTSLEKEYIKIALNESRWNVSQASRLLGLSRYSLQRRIEKYFPSVK